MLLKNRTKPNLHSGIKVKKLPTIWTIRKIPFMENTQAFLMSVNIIAFILAVVMGTNIDGATVEQGLNMGATSVNEVIEGDLFFADSFKFYALGLATFVVQHVVISNPIVEEELGSFRFFWFAMFTGVCSALFGLLGWAVVGGASGIAFALIGIIFSQIVIGRYKKIESYCYPDMAIIGMFLLPTLH